jgi:hypothetical protein
VLFEELFHPCTTIDGQSDAILYLIAFNNELFNGIIDGLRMKNRCCQKEGVNLRPQYLKGLGQRS